MRIFAVSMMILGGVLAGGPAMSQTQTPQPGSHPDPQTTDVGRRCADNPAVSGCPGTGQRVLPPTQQRAPGNGEMLTSPTGMMTDTGAHAPPKEQEAKPVAPNGPNPPPVSTGSESHPP